MRLSEAWDITTGNRDLVVAVVDTGVDYTPLDIKDNMWTDENGSHGYDFVNDDNDPMDGHGHGTHCAGIVAAVGNNSRGVVGVNWQRRIMAVKGLSDEGTGSVASLAAALYWAADHGADVISNSWGFIFHHPHDPVLEDAVRYAYTAGCVIVFAAGNQNDDVQYYCPQNMNETITVAATDYEDRKAWFSNWGELVDICAPGVEVLSSFPESLPAWYRYAIDVISDDSGDLIHTDLFQYSAIPSKEITAEVLDVGYGYPEDFTGQEFHGKIALMKRGGGIPCNEKVMNAYEAGAIAAIVYNYKSGNFQGVLGDEVEIPAFSISLEDGMYLVQLLEGSLVLVRIDGVNLGDCTVATGTSMACPYVSGVAALLLSKNNSLSPAEVKRLISLSADPVDSVVYIGRGRINALKTLMIEDAWVTPVIDSPSRGSIVNGTVEIIGTAAAAWFTYYVIEYGKGRYSEVDNWTELVNSSIVVEDDVLASLDTTMLHEGTYCIRLKVICENGLFEDMIWVVVNNRG